MTNQKIEKQPTERVKKVFYNFMKANAGLGIAMVILYTLLIVSEVLGIVGGGIASSTEIGGTTMTAMIMSLVIGFIIIFLLTIWASMVIVCIVFVNRQKYMDVSKPRSSLIFSLVFGLIFGIISLILGMMSYIHFGVGIAAIIFTILMFCTLCISLYKTLKTINLVRNNIKN